MGGHGAGVLALDLRDFADELCPAVHRADDGGGCGRDWEALGGRHGLQEGREPEGRHHHRLHHRRLAGAAGLGPEVPEQGSEVDVAEVSRLGALTQLRISMLHGRAEGQPMFRNLCTAEDSLLAMYRAVAATLASHAFWQLQRLLSLAHAGVTRMQGPCCCRLDTCNL